jgi:hypothetical protein
MKRLLLILFVISTAMFDGFGLVLQAPVSVPTSQHLTGEPVVGDDIVMGLAYTVSTFLPPAKISTGAQVAVKGTQIAIQKVGFNSFSAFKRAMGSAGTGQAWHHIVEQTPNNIAKFGTQAIHNTSNIVKLQHGAGSIHARISSYYSSIQPFTNGQTVRQWISTQNYQAQYDFGIQTLKKFGWTP